MRITILALLLGAGATAFCQSTSTAPAGPDKLRQIPPMFNWQGMDFSNQAPAWHLPSVAVQPMIVLQPGLPSVRLGDNALGNDFIDPKIIVHPPKSSLGVQQPGTLMAQNQFPNLRFLPIDGSGKKSMVIPPTWPNLKLQRIPIMWPKFTLLPVVSHTDITPKP